MNPDEVLNLLTQAMNEAVASDEYLFRVVASERNLAGRLGIHLQPRLPDWHVDPEYNRMAGSAPKRFICPLSEQATEMRMISFSSAPI